MSDARGAETALARLQQHLSAVGPVAVAVSGGVDSMTLACVAHRTNASTRLFHALSAAVPADATERVHRYARREGWNLSVIDAGELNDASYVSNPVDRCYYCKSCLYDTIRGETDLPVASGTNVDDLSDYRPGLRAAGERGVVHPYVEVGIDKATVRSISRLLALDDLAELPASPCLSSRVTTGIAIDPAVLKVIDEVESAIRQRVDDAVQGVRCRIREEEVAIELEIAGSEAEITRYEDAVASAARAIIARHGMSERYRRLSVAPYRRGSAFLIESVHLDE